VRRQGKLVDADAAERHLCPLVAEMVDDRAQRGGHRFRGIVAGEEPGGEQQKEESQRVFDAPLPAGRSFAAQPDEVGAQPGLRIAVRHPSGTCREGVLRVDELAREVHVPMPARAPAVPDETVPHSRRNEQVTAR